MPVATLGNWCGDLRSGNTQTEAKPAANAPVCSRRPVNDLEAGVSRLRKELASAKLDIFCMAVFDKQKIRIGE